MDRHSYYRNQDSSGRAYLRPVEVAVGSHLPRYDAQRQDRGSERGYRGGEEEDPEMHHLSSGMRALTWHDPSSASPGSGTS
ncbi:hypothetical protein MNV49_004445 [Pseudohyphozyma bogoriensis]|nr:hypothetical protein MNV49_004445 [Pseudohyphozyma bogoriensis]